MATEKPNELPISERDRRYRIIRDEMKKRGLDCLILWGNGGHFEARTGNIRYISQVGGGGEDAYAVFPVEGEPTVFTWSSGAHLEEWVRSQSWVTDLRPGRQPGYGENVVRRVKELKLEKGSIGLVATMHNYHMPYPEYLKITQALPGAKFENATEMLDEIRAVKSPAEVEILERASEIGDKAIDTLYETARSGVREDVVQAKMVYTILTAGGAEIPSMFLWDCGQPQRAQRLTYTQGKVLKKGDVICTEFSPRVQGYYGHFSWPLVVGRNKDYEDLFEAAKESYFSALKALKPGISGEDLFQAFNKPVEERGYVWGGARPGEPMGGHGPYFHGIGVAWDPPRRDEKLIKAGMTIGFEPGAGTRDGKMGIHVGDIVVVTENGCRRLGRHPIEFVSV